MNKVLYGLGIGLLLLGASCQKDDVPTAEPPRPHADVYAEDLVKIEDYLHRYYIDVTKNPDGDVTNVEMKPLDETHTVSIWDQTEYPLLYKMVKRFGVEFKVYYLKLDDKDDTDASGKKPCGVDKVYTSYKGEWLTREYISEEEGYELETGQFDNTPNQVAINLVSVQTKGWEYIFPEFRSGQNSNNADGTLSHTNYGSGVMFLPSGLGYYNQAAGTIPYYAPLIFTFNLYDVEYVDNDFDLIESRYEYVLNEDGTLLDTDADGIPNVFDADDDNDGFSTKNEIKYIDPDDPNDVVRYYPFNGAAIDDLSTPYVDERQGIPACGGVDFTSPTRVRKHLDKNCN